MIIILLSNYPYVGGEHFVNNEILELSKKENDIYICPLYPDNDTLQYEVPANVKILKLNKGRKSLKYLTRGFFSTILDADFWTDIAACVKSRKSPKAILASIYYFNQINSAYFQIRGWIRRKKVQGDSITFYSYWMHTHACIAAKLKKENAGSFFVTRCHGYDLYEDRSSSGYLPGRKLIFEQADYILPISNQGKQYLCSTYRIQHKNRIEVCYLGTFEQGKNPYSPNLIRIVSCSNLVPLKRVEVIIDALSMLQFENIEWIHFGGGALLEKIKAKAQILLNTKVKFDFRGAVDNAEIMKYYRENSITLFVNASQYEGLPVSIMEAMSFGIPAVATDVGGTKEIVKNDFNGYLVDKNLSPEVLAEKIEKYVKLSEDQKKAFRANARDTWQQFFDASVNYEKFYYMALNNIGI